VSNLFRDGSFSLPSERTEYIQDGVTFLRADRQPCPVCGHPTGDCSGDDETKVKVAFATEQTKLESLKHSQKILVEQDIYEERQITPFTKISVRIAKKGSYVTLDRAKELGILES